MMKLKKSLIALAAALLLLLPVSVPAFAADEPVIRAQPQNYVYPEGCVASYTVEAEGKDLSYHWYIVFNGTTYDTMDTDVSAPWLYYVGESCGPSQSGDSYFFNGIDAGLNGAEIYCKISSGSKTVTSAKAVITVDGSKLPPKDFTVPVKVNIPVNYGGGLIKLACQSPNADQYSFQWYETGTGKLQDIIATDFNEMIAVLPTNEAGTKYYVCMITTPEGGRAYSSVVPMTIYESKPTEPPKKETPAGGNKTPSPYILQVLTQPTDLSVNDGETATFSCSAKAEGMIRYQWWSSDKDPVDIKSADAVKLQDGDGLSGSTSNTLKVTANTQTDGKYFLCELTGEGGETLCTDTVKLSVNRIEGQKPGETDSVKPSPTASASAQLQPTTQKEARGISTGLLLLIIILSVLLAGAIAAIIILLVKKKKNNTP